MNYICKTYEDYENNYKNGKDGDLMVMHPEVWKYIIKNPDKLTPFDIGHSYKYKIIKPE